MATPETPPNLINVSMPALAEPHFIIKVGDAYFLTLAAWEYDMGRAEITEDQKRGVQLIAQLFNDGMRRPQAVKVEAVVAEPAALEKVLQGGRTRPPAHGGRTSTPT